MEILGLVDRAYHLFQHEKKTAKEIAGILEKEGYMVSKTGVSRALRKKRLDMRRFEETMEQAKVIVHATEGRPGTEIGEASLQLALVKLLEELKGIEDFREMAPDQVLLATSRIARALTAISKLKLDYEKGYQAGLFKMRQAAAGEVEKEARRLGISDELAEEIKRKILRLNDGPA